ncbi:hypothetical protein [Nakamurella lactea]|uniref:hypothetical protein n=1 Tax=Nakamurella lactea TaxID=459515 RepID=UPI0004157FF7|nr:hypothetical protein [Nakamurella lactea]
MHLRSRPGGVLSAVAACCLLLLTGCAGNARTGANASTSPLPHATVGQDFYDAQNPPPPEGTITPSAGSWDRVHPPKGYRAVLLSMGTDGPTTTLVTAIDEWAGQEGVDLQHITVPDHHQIIDKATQAIDLRLDLVIVAGNDLIDPMALITAAHLQQNFLVVGAELAEPTHNVTAADWTGASFRGEGLGASSTYDPTSFTPERAARAVRAGAAAVLSNHTGIVVWLD